MKGDSTVSQLAYIVHNIRKNWAGKKITQGLFLDVHNGLLAKLACLVLRELTLSVHIWQAKAKFWLLMVSSKKSRQVRHKAWDPFIY